MNDIHITYDMRHVANFLKSAMNANCEKGFKWYKEVGDMPNVFEVEEAIRRLDAMGVVGEFTVVNDGEDGDA